MYDDVYGIPTFVTLIGGAVLFSAASIRRARAAAAIHGVPRWARVAYGTSGPLIGFLGIAFGPLQTLGSLAVNRRMGARAADGGVDVTRPGGAWVGPLRQTDRPGRRQPSHGSGFTSSSTTSWGCSGAA